MGGRLSPFSQSRQSVIPSAAACLALICLTHGGACVFGQSTTKVPFCFESFQKQAEPLLLDDGDTAELAAILRSHRSFAQRLIRITFLNYIEKAAVGSNFEAPLHAAAISRLAVAWQRSFPDLPLLVPWPEARHWSPRQVRRYWSFRQASDQAQALYHHGRFSEARDVWSRSLKVFQELGATHAASTLWMNLGLCHYEFGDLRSAESYLRRALGLKERFGDDEGRRDCLMNLSMVAEMQGHYPVAKALLDKAHELNSALCDDATEARIVSSLGVLAKETGQLAAAEHYYRRSLELRRKAKDTEGEATDINNLGVVLGLRGLLQEALSAYQQSLELRRNTGDREGEADSLLNLSEAYAQMGQASKSMESFFLALRIYETLGSPHRTVSAWGQAGGVFLQQGNVAQAETFFRAGLQLARQHGFQSQVAAFKIHLASAAALVRDYSAAESLIREALNSYEKAGDETAACGAMLELGRLFLEQEDYGQAAAWLLRSFQRAVGNGLSSELAESSLELGFLALAGQKAGVAEQYFTAAAALGAGSGLTDLQWKAHEGLSQAYESQGRLESARWYLELAVAQVLQLEADIPLVSLAVHFWDDKARLFRRMSRLAESEGEMAAAWAWTDFMKARLIKRSLSEQWKRPADSTVQAGRDKEHPIRAELRDLYLHMSRLQGTEPARLAELSLRIEDLHRSVSQSSPEKLPEVPRFRASQSRRWLQEMQSRLAEGEAYIDFSLHTDSLWAWVADPSSLQLIRLNLSEKEIHDLMREAGLWTGTDSTRSTSQYRISSDNPARIASRNALERIGRELWIPIASRLPRDTRSLVIIPDGILHLLPFEILSQDASQKGTGDASGGSFLLEHYAISYLPAASLLNARPSSRPGEEVQVVALAPGLEKPTASLKLPSDASPAVESSRSAISAPRMPLKIGGEVDALAGIFPAAQVFRGIDGVREDFIQAASKAKVLHIASHYRFNPQRPEFSQFAMADGEGAAESLFAFEATLMQLKSDLTVLSACNSGWGNVYPGEGLLNLGRAFLVAGSKSVVISMWPVEEESTATLMRHFYQFLSQGLDTRDALRRAKLELRKTPRWSHPFYWGSFVLVGNPVQIRPPENSSASAVVVSGVILLGVVVLMGLLLRRSIDSARLKSIP